MPKRTIARTRLLAVALSGAVLLAACGTDADQEPAASPPPTSSRPAATPPFDTVQAAPMSSTEHDRLLAAAFDAQNRLYAAGWLAAGDDQMMAVTRFGPDGRVDTAFGTGGVATVNVAKGGKTVELARGVVVQASGKVVVAGPVEHDTAATGDAAKDTDVALARFDPDGRLDPTFGTAGVVRLDLSTGVAEGTAYRSDTSWGLTKLADEKLLVVAAQIGPGAGRTDLDFAVVRLTADGVKDTTFGSGGVAVVNAGPNVTDTPRSAIELAGGKVLVSGYASIGGVVQTILFRLTPAGALDPTFGTDGISVRAMLGNVAEAYAVGVLGNGRIITGGYGKDTAEAKVDLISGGFTPDGAVDTAHGTNGVVRVDVAGDDDRARSLVVLPGGGAVLVGSGKPTGTNLDAMVVRLTAAGALDPAFGTNGYKLYDLGGPNDSFFGVALSPDRTMVAAVGYLGREAGGSAKDDGAVLWLRP